MSESFCLTGDSLIKILAIVHRTKCQIPGSYCDIFHNYFYINPNITAIMVVHISSFAVVLMGECGCGKTMLLRFLCRWLGVELISLDIHGGTTEKEIVGVLSAATALMDNSMGGIKTVFVFLDEVNTCDHMGLINEIVCHRSIYGKNY